VPAILKRFRQSVLAAACSGQLTADWREEHLDMQTGEALLQTIKSDRKVRKGKQRQLSKDKIDLDQLPEIPEQWGWETIGQVADIQGGIQKQPKRAPKDNPYPYLRVANVLRDKLDLSEIHQMELFDGELEIYRLEPGDLLIVEGNGSLSQIGRSAVWNGEIANIVHQNHIIRVRTHWCSTRYLNTYWNSPLGIERITDVAVTTSGLYSLSTKKIANIIAPIPPLAEQQEIVRRVKALFTLADRIEQRAKVATERVEKTTQSILGRAFRGELVETEAELARREGRDYESAAQLLACIQAEREKSVSTMPKRKSRARRSVQ
jgi:type I restriction enzyme S subunit